MQAIKAAQWSVARVCRIWHWQDPRLARAAELPD
jgi:hypothetical protein